MILRLCLLLVFALAFARGAIEEHRILTLPGYGKPKTKMYSGYIDTPHPTNISTTVHSHYWFVTCSECMDSASAPTLIWMQGGPGGSSLIGLFTENGPLTLNDFSVETDAFNQSGVPTVFDNPYSWHALANVVYFEHPAPTGFSYCSGYGNDSFSCPPWDDTLQAESSYAFFVAFFEHYPELKENPFLLSGESYAGVLVPTLVQNLLARRTKDNVKTAPWSVSGFALGNDCPGNRVYTCTPYSGWIGTQVALDFRFRHGMISEDLYAEINDACAGEWGTFEAPRSETCRTLLEDPIHPVMSEAGNTYEMGNGYYLYDTCDPDLLAIDPATNRPRDLAEEEYTVAHLVARRDERTRKRVLESPYPSTGDDRWYRNSGTYACGQERASTVWLNLDAVREAIHVQTRNESGRAFSFSTTLPSYGFSAHSLLQLYNETLVTSGLRILQYSGDADPCVPYIGTARWIESLNLPVAKPWRPWKAMSEYSGYVVRYETTNTNGGDKDGYFDFVTIRNAGHMVPRYKPAAALEMMRTFLTGKDPVGVSQAKARVLA